MKLNRIIVLASALVLLTASGAAAQMTPMGTTTPNVNAPLERASAIIGADVENPQGESLGTVKDIVIDRDTGQIAYAVITGMSGAKNKLFAVPWKALKTGTTATTLSLNISKSKLEKAPSFNENEKWPDMANRSYGTKIFKYYGLTPYWEEKSMEKSSPEEEHEENY